MFVEMFSMESWGMLFFVRNCLCVICIGVVKLFVCRCFVVLSMRCVELFFV